MSREINNSNETTIERVIMAGIDEALANIHTMTIAKVTKVESKTINVKPVFNRVVDGVSIELPEFIEVPLITLHGGANYIHLPITVGDYAMLFFAERCTDSWYAGQDFKAPLEYRIHDYSDGFALVGVNPQSSAITIPNITQMTGNTNQDGNYTHQGNREQTGDYTLTGDFTINGETVKNGNLIVNGNITITGGSGGGTVNATDCNINLTGGDLKADGVSLKNHTHTDSMGGTTSPPN